MELQDARPFLQVSEDSLWAVAERNADEIVSQLKASLVHRKINAAVTRSPKGTHPVVVRLDAWIPKSSGARSGATRTVGRISLTFTCQIQPFNRHKFVYDVGVSREGQEKNYSGLLKFMSSEAVKWLDFALRTGTNPRSGEKFAVFLFSIIPLPMLSPKYNPVDRQFRNGFPPPLPVLLFWLGVIAVGIGAAINSETNYYYDDDPSGPIAIAAGIATIVLATIISVRRRKLVTVLDKPPTEPRFPKMVDSWNTIVPKLGDDHNSVRLRLFDAVQSRPVDRMTASIETYAYFGADGYIEREQLVIRIGQALVHIHVYDFDDELFVGWDSNLNLVRWIETGPQSSRVEEGQLNQFCSLTAGYHQPNEYDLVDLNVVTELAHRRLKAELQAILKERAIDEEIDFSIVRGAREDLVKKDESEIQKSGQTGSLLGRAAKRFQRQ